MDEEVQLKNILSGLASKQRIAEAIIATQTDPHFQNMATQSDPPKSDATTQVHETGVVTTQDVGTNVVTPIAALTTKYAKRLEAALQKLEDANYKWYKKNMEFKNPPGVSVLTVIETMAAKTLISKDVPVLDIIKSVMSPNKASPAKASSSSASASSSAKALPKKTNLLNLFDEN